jgi:molybdate-binding protein
MSLALDPNAHVLTLHASHDDALSSFRDHAAQQGLHLDLKFNGSLVALQDLNEGRCTIAGFHTLANVSSQSHIAHIYKPLLKPGLHKLMGFAARQQGLITAPGNPFQLQSLADVIQRRARFANRAEGTGTRVLLDHWLKAHARQTLDIHGYESIEQSHAAVAERVASGQADVGLGTQLAAHQRGLCFVPWVEERYYFVCLKSAVDDPAILKMQATLRSPSWMEALSHLQGYTPHTPGQVLSLRHELPWWQYKKPKI